MSESGECDGAAGRAGADAIRAFVVAGIAAVVAVAWCLLVLGRVAMWVVLFAIPSSAVVWFCIASRLASVSDPPRRLAEALGLGLFSPVAGMFLASMACGCCVLPCLGSGVAAAAFGFLSFWKEPWLWLPVGAGMGLVAFVVVSVRRAPPKS